MNLSADVHLRLVILLMSVEKVKNKVGTVDKPRWRTAHSLAALPKMAQRSSFSI